MAKKDFTQVNKGRVYNTIAAATEDTAAAPEDIQEIIEEQPKRKARKTYTEQEAAEILQTLHTAGRKGLKLPRINLAFAPEIHAYIVTMSRARGETLTDFVNKVLREHMEQHRDIYEKAIEFRNSL